MAAALALLAKQVVEDLARRGRLQLVQERGLRGGVRELLGGGLEDDRVLGDHGALLLVVVSPRLRAGFATPTWFRKGAFASNSDD